MHCYTECIWVILSLKCEFQDHVTYQNVKLLFKREVEEVFSLSLLFRLWLEKLMDYLMFVAVKNEWCFLFSFLFFPRFSSNLWQLNTKIFQFLGRDWATWTFPVPLKACLLRGARLISQFFFILEINQIKRNLHHLPAGDVNSFLLPCIWCFQ